ncbi:MAG: energy transducer TonB [bacterium]
MALRKNPKVDLKLKYNRYFEISLIISLTIIILSFKYFPEFKAKTFKPIEHQEVINLEDVISTKQDNIPPPPPKMIIPVESSLGNNFDDLELKETVIDDVDLSEQLSAPTNKTNKPITEEKKTQEEFIFLVGVEMEPEPIGGIEGIQARVKIPESAKKNNIQGRVFVKAFINLYGDVVKVNLIKGIGNGCDEAVMKAVRQTKFKPGKQKGKYVSVQLTMPITVKY